MSERKLYELTPAQGMINIMLKYSFFHKQVIQIPMSITFDKKVDFDLMKKAFNIEIERNDCMRLRFLKKGGKQYQYFLDEYKVDDIQVKTFKTKEEQEAFLTADASTTIHHMKGELFRVYFFNSYDGKQGIYINVCHLAMDAAAVFIFFSDLFAVYDSLEAGTELPKPLSKYEDAIQREHAYINNKTRIESEKAFFADFFTKDGLPVFNGVHGPELLQKAREKKKNPKLRFLANFDPIHDKANLIKRPISKEDSEIILNFIDSEKISPECLVQLGMRLHVGKLNESVNDGILDTYFISLCTRRKTLKDKRCGGTLTNTLPWRIILPKEATFKEAILQMQDLQHTMFRHQDYPFEQWRDLECETYNISLADGASTMMFSWFPLEKDTMNGWNYEFTGYSIGRYCMPLYTYAMKDCSTNTLRFAYLYRTQHISADNINALHDNAVKALLLGCQNPEMTIGEICDLL